MSQQIVWDLLTNTAEAATTLGDHELAAQVKSTVDNLDPGLRARGDVTVDIGWANGNPVRTRRAYRPHGRGPR